MHKIPFAKLHGAGNDFIILSGPDIQWEPTKEEIQRICHRRLGVGADGLIILQPHEQYGFEMLYFNPDGSSGMLCGNGARCAVSRAFQLNWINKETTFLAADGPHTATVFDEKDIEISMQDVGKVEPCLNGYFLQTGAPHYVEFVEELDEYQVHDRGRQYRYHALFQPKGTNANFIEEENGKLKIRTYERGVESETLACGTGITASALVYARDQKASEVSVDVLAKGGDLRIRATKKGDGFEKVFMRGPVATVFEGEYLLSS